jgi:hypothetical protein
MTQVAASRRLGVGIRRVGRWNRTYSAREMVGKGDRANATSPTVAVKNSLDTPQFVFLTARPMGVG